MTRHGRHASIPVLCIGNFTVGGAGKTPAAIAIARRLQARGETPVFLSRGYRGHFGRGPCRVDLTKHSAEDVGDEALLLARVAPTIAGADRRASASAAEKIGASLLILDDGLQNPSLIHDWRLAVIDRSTGTGNGLCLPAGPLRAPLNRQLALASAVLFAGKGENPAGLNETVRGFGKPVFTAKLVPAHEIARKLAGQRVLAFAGIGLPRKFKATLEDLGANIVEWRSFPDHYVYTLAELQNLQAKAAQKEALFVTTEKDLVRIAPLLGNLDANLPRPLALPVRLVFDDEQALDHLLTVALQEARTKIAAGLRACSAKVCAVLR